MLIKRVLGANRVLTGPPGDHADDVSDLPIRDVFVEDMHFMVSAFEPTPEEIKALLAGAPLLLWISAPQHPVCAITVGYGPDWTEEPGALSL